jgi:predicted amidohydrolase YtcJ
MSLANLQSLLRHTCRHLLLIGVCASSFAQTAPTLQILKNANGYTMLPGLQLRQFTSLAFDSTGKIRAVGSLAEVQAALGAEFANAQQLDVAGKTVLPGLIDAHGHVFSLGEAVNELQLRDSKSLPQAQSMIANYAKAHPEAQWIIGFGWNQAVWQLPRFPHVRELDAVTGVRPAWLVRVDGHAAWVNSAALKLAGINKATPDPQGGKIERDEQGEATGILLDSAMALVSKILPAASDAEQRAALEASMRELASLGLTSVHDAGVSASQDRLYREYAAQGRLSTRVYGMLRMKDFDEVAEQGILHSMAQDHYALRAVKVFGDGALGSRGAALLTPLSLIHI